MVKLQWKAWESKERLQTVVLVAEVQILFEFLFMSIHIVFFKMESMCLWLNGNSSYIDVA